MVVNALRGMHIREGSGYDLGGIRDTMSSNAIEIMVMWV